jgi:hypothetical protein
MALKKDAVITQDGFEGMLFFRNAYWKINRIDGNKNGMHINVFCYVGDKLFKQESYHFLPEIDGENFIKQAYVYLKTLPEFAGAVDC